MGRQLEGKKHQRELAIMQNDLLGPQLAVNHSGLIFIFSLLLFVSRYGLLFFKIIFSPERESPEILILRHDKKEKKIKIKPEQQRKQGKTATTNNKFLGELLIVFSYFFFFTSAHFLPPVGCCVKKITLAPSPNQWHTISSRQ